MKVHCHPCKHCQTPVECEGELTANYDGWPTMICSARHRPGGYTEDSLCDSCKAAAEAEA